MTQRYVVVVHGIGEQRLDETVRAVIHRFAEARAGRRLRSPLTYGRLRSLADRHAWIETAAIPLAADPQTPPFAGRSPVVRGENLRFVDFLWSDLLRSSFEGAGEDVVAWSRALVARLEATEVPGRPTAWIREILGNLRTAVKWVRRGLRARFASATELIFDKFLGDAQIYGEWQAMRGGAVRRFHDQMNALVADHAADWRAADYRITVIAHSLGSVLAMDALLYAHARDGMLASVPGYPKPDEPIPARDWISRVDSFVTLGSPIDKYLALWWFNYEHLVDADWMNPPARRIPLYVYCDEQDPVGHRLDLAQSAPAFARVFDKVEERVYCRYWLPGVAHVDYWKDRALFGRILALVQDGATPDTAPAMLFFKPWAYVSALLFSYLVLPLAAWAGTAIPLALAFNADGWMARGTLFVMAAIAFVVGTTAITLMVLWRQALVCLRQRTVGTKPHAPGDKCGGPWRTASGWVARAVITLVPLLCYAALPAAWSADWAARLPDWLAALVRHTTKSGVPTGALVVGIGFFLTAWNAAYFWLTKWRWMRMEMPADFPAYVRADPSPDPSRPMRVHLEKDDPPARQAITRAALALAVAMGYERRASPPGRDEAWVVVTDVAKRQVVDLLRPLVVEHVNAGAPSPALSREVVDGVAALRQALESAPEVALQLDAMFVVRRRGRVAARMLQRAELNELSGHRPRDRYVATVRELMKGVVPERAAEPVAPKA